MKILRLILILFFIFIIQYLGFKSLFAIKFPSFGRKSSSTTATTTKPTSTSTTTSRWQKFKQKFSREKPPTQQPTTVTQQPSTAQPSSVGTTTGQQAAVKPSLWQKFKQKLPGRTPSSTAPTQPTSTTTIEEQPSAPPPPPPAPAAVPPPPPVPAEPTSVQEGPEEKPRIGWWQKAEKPETPSTKSEIQISQQRAKPKQEEETIEEAVTTKEGEKTEEIAVTQSEATVSEEPSDIPESRWQRVKRGVQTVGAKTQQGLQGTATAVQQGGQLIREGAQIAHEVAGTAASIAGMFRKPQQTGDMPSTAYPQEQYPLPQQPVPETISEQQQKMAPPPVSAPMAEQIKPSEEQIRVEVKEEKIEEEKIVGRVEEVKKTPQELVREFNGIVDNIANFKPEMSKENIKNFNLLIDKASENLKQLIATQDQFPAVVKQLQEINETLIGIEKIGQWSKEFKLTEEQYFTIAKNKILETKQQFMQILTAPKQSEH
ncbi:hypothetical protein GF322_01535 [Candidatus Dependentiae bacterium]|nr:hypothetical protein [Candidatus Dependentiae bacterium]